MGITGQIHFHSPKVHIECKIPLLVTAVRFCAIDCLEYMVGTWKMVNALQAPEAPSIAFALHQVPNLNEDGPGYEQESLCILFCIGFKRCQHSDSLTDKVLGFLRLINYFDLFRTDFNGLKEILFPKKRTNNRKSSLSQCSRCLNTRMASVIFFK